MQRAHEDTSSVESNVRALTKRVEQAVGQKQQAEADMAAMLARQREQEAAIKRLESMRESEALQFQEHLHGLSLKLSHMRLLQSEMVEASLQAQELAVPGGLAHGHGGAGAGPATGMRPAPRVGFFTPGHGLRTNGNTQPPMQLSFLDSSQHQ